MSIMDFSVVIFSWCSVNTLFYFSAFKQNLHPLSDKVIKLYVRYFRLNW